MVAVRYTIRRTATENVNISLPDIRASAVASGAAITIRSIDPNGEFEIEVGGTVSAIDRMESLGYLNFPRLSHPYDQESN